MNFRSMLPCSTICTKSLVTMAFTFIFQVVIAVSDLNINIGGSTDLAKKCTDQRIGIPLYLPPPLLRLKEGVESLL